MPVCHTQQTPARLLTIGAGRGADGAMEHAPQPREKKSGSAQASQPGIKLNQPASEKKEEKKRKKGPKIAWRAPKKRP